MTDAERIYEEYRAAWPDLDTALKVAAMEISALGRKASAGYARAVREVEPRQPKAKPPAVTLTSEHDA